MPITGAPPDIPVSVRVYSNVAQLIPNGVWTAIIFNNQRWDDPNDDQWAAAPNPTRLTCRVAGPYAIAGEIMWDAHVVGIRWIGIRLNDTDDIRTLSHQNLSADSLAQSVATVYKLAVGDFVELRAYQNSGGGLFVLTPGGQQSPEFSMVRCV